MAALALAVGEPAEGQQVGAGEEPDAILELEPISGVEPFGDIVRGPAAVNAGAPCSGPPLRALRTLHLTERQH